MQSALPWVEDRGCETVRQQGKQNGKQRLFASLVLVGLALAGTVSAQKLAPLPIENVVGMRALSASPRQFSPDGRFVSYTVTLRQTKELRGTEDEGYLRTGVGWDSLGSDIHVLDLQTNQDRSLTEGVGNNWSPKWSPDGRFLAFQSTRDGSQQAKLWIWDVRRNRLKKIADVPLRAPGPVQMQWTADSANIAVTILPEGLSVEEFARAVEVPAQDREEARREPHSTAVVYRGRSSDSGTASSDPLTLQNSVHDLALISVASGSVRTLVHGQRIGTFYVSADGSQIFYSTPERFENPASQQLLHSLSVVETASGKSGKLVADLRMDLSGTFSLSPDGSKIAVRFYGQEDKWDIYILDAKDGQMKNVSYFSKQPRSPIAGNERAVYSATLLWAPGGEDVYGVTAGALWATSVKQGTTRELARIEGRVIRDVLAQGENVLATDPSGRFTMVITRDAEQKQDGFYRIDLRSGEATKLLERGECYTCDAGQRGHLATLSNDGRVLYSAQDAEHPGDLWLSDPSFEIPARLSRLNPKLDEYKMGAARLVEWFSDDGQALRGALILPAGYESGKRYPLVVLVYGGVAVSDSLRVFGGFERGMPQLNVQVLATRGYAVLMPDAPQQMGTPMLDLAKTVLPGINRVVELGVADPARVAVLGHSYGGYSALSLIVQTNRFKAAVALDGMGNLISLYGEMDQAGIAFGTSSETGQQLMGGNPWTERSRYIENSPLFYLDRVRTPVLLVHGAADTNTAAFLSDEVFVALRRLGKIVEYARYEGEDHVFLKEENQRDVCNRIVRWFDKYLKTP